MEKNAQVVIVRTEKNGFIYRDIVLNIELYDGTSINIKVAPKFISGNTLKKLLYKIDMGLQNGKETSK